MLLKLQATLTIAFSLQHRPSQEVDKTGRSTIYINDGVGSETQLPLYVIVDQKTASASEILTAALQDNHRATVVGATKTFGKGRIQNVQALSSGSGIAITKAKYMTPSGRDIQSVGIDPDVKSQKCSSGDSALDCLEGLL
jgi:carboxyl-terminal processing protease